MATRKQMVEERNARIDAKQRENELQSKVYNHPVMQKEVKRQQLVREFMLAVASGFDYDDDDSAEKVHSAALELATVYMVRSKEWLDGTEGDVLYDLTGE